MPSLEAQKDHMKSRRSILLDGDAPGALRVPQKTPCVLLREAPNCSHWVSTFFLLPYEQSHFEGKIALAYRS